MRNNLITAGLFLALFVVCRSAFAVEPTYMSISLEAPSTLPINCKQRMIKSADILSAQLGLETRSVVRFDTQIEVTGKFKAFIAETDGTPAYVQFEGPSRITKNGRLIKHQGEARHPHGYGTAVGPLQDGRQLSALTERELDTFRVPGADRYRISFRSGVVIEGKKVSTIRERSGSTLLFTFEDCTVTQGKTVLYQPEWGPYDFVPGLAVESARIE